MPNNIPYAEVRVNAYGTQKMMTMILPSLIVFIVILNLASVVEAANIGPDGICALPTFVPFTFLG
jgi:hypothetical protein